MSRKKGVKSKTESKEITVTDASASVEPVILGPIKAKATPRSGVAPKAQKTDDLGVRGEGGEFIKRGGKLYRS